MLKNLYVNSTRKEIKKAAVHKLIAELRNELHFKISSLSVSFISAAEIAEINNRYLNHNFSTDIITFDYSEEKSKIDAEILISIEDAAQNAKKFKVKFQEEITRLVIHGILHILGYNDINPEEKKIMKLKENQLTKKLKFILLRSR